MSEQHFTQSKHFPGERPCAQAKHCDRNGEVVLGLRKLCGRAEVELEKPCAHTAAREVR